MFKTGKSQVYICNDQNAKFLFRSLFSVCRSLSFLHPRLAFNCIVFFCYVFQNPYKCVDKLILSVHIEIHLCLYTYLPQVSVHLLLRNMLLKQIKITKQPTEVHVYYVLHGKRRGLW